MSGQESERWAVYQLYAATAVVPIEDKREHVNFDQNCPCEPKIRWGEYGNLVITHNAFDFRDVAEWLEEQRGGAA